MVLPRPATPSVARRLALRLHPRRLRRRLPAAVAAAGLVTAGSLLAPARPQSSETWPVVLVAAADLEAGAVIGPGDVVARRVPPDVVPDDAATTVTEGSLVRSAIGRGEIVVDRRLSGTGIPARLRPDQRALAVAWPAARPPVVVGDTVDLVATTAGDGTGPPTTRVLVEGATVLAVADDGITVAVPATATSAVHHAVAGGVLDLAVTPLRE